MPEQTDFEKYAPVLDYYGYINPMVENPRSETLTQDWQQMFPNISPKEFCKILTTNIPENRTVQLGVFGFSDGVRREQGEKIRESLAPYNVDEEFVAATIKTAEGNMAEAGVGIKITENEKDVGQLQWKLFPSKHSAVADVFIDQPEYRSTAVARTLWQNGIALCDKMGIQTLEMLFDVGDLYSKSGGGLEIQKDVTSNGLYSALGIGAIPQNWDVLREELQTRFEGLREKIDNPLVVTMIEEALNNPDPHAAWEIADCKARITLEDGKKTSVGKALLVGVRAEGTLDLSEGSLSRERLDYFLKGRETRQWVDRPGFSGKSAGMGKFD